jgi:hypothetical protein
MPVQRPVAGDNPTRPRNLATRWHVPTCGPTRQETIERDAAIGSKRGDGASDTDFLIAGVDQDHLAALHRGRRLLTSQLKGDVHIRHRHRVAAAYPITSCQ